MKHHTTRRQRAELLEPRYLLAALTSGVTLEDSISSPAEVDIHSISMSAGQTLVVALGENDGQALDPQVELRNPGGGTVRTDSGESGTFYHLTAAGSGSYQLRISDNGNNNTGNYQLTVYRSGVTPGSGEEGGTSQSGRRRAATIEAGDLDIWTQDLTAGQFFGISVAENTVGRSVDIGVLVFSPNGTLLSDVSNEKGVEINIAANQSVTGTYTIVIYEPGANDSDRYGLSFGVFPGVQYDGDPDTVSPLANNVTRAGDLPGADYDIWPISITSGQTISATIAKTTGSLEPKLTLFSPGGAVLDTANGASSATVSAVASSSGTYWLLAVDRESDDGGQYNIQYTATAPDPNPPPLADSLLTVEGTGDNDHIVVSLATQNGVPKVQVRVNGADTFYNKSEVERIEIYAGAGDDIVETSTDIPTYIFGDTGNDYLLGGSGQDTLSGAAGKNTLLGGNGPDRLNGSGGRDLLYGEGGDDRLYGNGGDDTLDGGGNVDRLWGGDGNDILIGASSNDKLYGEAGNDTLFGGKGTDLFDGGPGTDTRGDSDPGELVTAIEL